MKTVFKFLIKNLFRNRVTSLITITGFAVSISMALLLISFIVNEYKVDSDYPNLSRIYRVVQNNNNASIAEEIPAYLKEKYPQIEDACTYNNFGVSLNIDNTIFSGQMAATDPSFFSMFSTEFILGDKQSALNDLNDVVLTESFAKKLFGDENPVGKIIVAEHGESLTVSGVIKDLPENSSIRIDLIANSKLRIINQLTADDKGNLIYFFRPFLLLKEGVADIPNFEKMVSEDLSLMKFSVDHYSLGEISLLPFNNSYFKQGLNQSQTRHANVDLIQILSIITIIILALATINYINLSTAGHLKRLKEIGIRKTNGASRKQIFMQFMAESFLVSLISFIIAIFLVRFFAPLFDQFLNSSINLSILLEPTGLIGLCFGVTFIALLSGFYPALSISRLTPAVIMSRNAEKKGELFGFRATLNTVQYAVSITLIIALIVLSKQINFVKAKDFGFDTDTLLKVEVHWKLRARINYLKDKLISDPRINNICFTDGTPGDIRMTRSWEDLGKENNRLNVLMADTAFLNIFELPIIKGREASPLDKKVCYMNETAFKRTEWETIEGKEWNGNKIIGVVKDFHIASMYNEITPLIISVITDPKQTRFSHITLKIAPGDINTSVAALEEIWEEVCPGYELNYIFYDDWFDSMYKKEENLAASIRLFAILAIFISCLGIFGLAEFSTKKRTKEIGIRKVNGAKVSEILTMLNRDFVKWVVVAFVIACPVAYYTMNRWLENFAYRTSLSWWIFALSGLLALGIALLTVSWHSWKAATRNPVEALKSE